MDLTLPRAPKASLRTGLQEALPVATAAVGEARPRTRLWEEELGHSRPGRVGCARCRQGGGGQAGSLLGGEHEGLAFWVVQESQPRTVSERGQGWRCGNRSESLTVLSGPRGRPGKTQNSLQAAPHFTEVLGAELGTCRRLCRVLLEGDVSHSEFLRPLVQRPW